LCLLDAALMSACGFVLEPAQGSWTETLFHKFGFGPTPGLDFAPLDHDLVALELAPFEKAQGVVFACE
jgi:hypothetical protein